MPAEPDAGEPTFVANQGDFYGFTSWTSYDGGTSADDSLDGGQRTLYLNRPPPPGASVFPVGTIFVKTTAGADTFAMAKRGGGFNPALDDWEWFQLAPAADGDVQIIWRGLGPTGTFVYANMPPTGCTDCHLLAYTNDFVAGPAPQLKMF